MSGFEQDDGIVTATLNGTVLDEAGNESEAINETIDSEIKLVLEIGTKYEYKVNGAEINKKYLVENDKLTIIKTVYEKKFFVCASAFDNAAFIFNRKKQRSFL